MNRSINVLILLITFCSIAQQNQIIKLDEYLDVLESNNKFMGSVAVAKDGKIIYTKAVGYADVEKKIKATPETKYHIGSISKTFTTVMVFKAVEEGKIKLSDKLDQFYPEIRNSDKINIEDLLGHRSGIHNFTNNPDFLTWNTQAKSEKEMIEVIKKGGSSFEPGTQFGYSNSNYVLLSFILEKIYKDKYGNLLNKFITKPLGLNDTGMGKKINSDKGDSYSYSYNGKTWLNAGETDMSIPLGAGGIVSTTSDMLLFANALMNGKLIENESYNRMTSLKEGFGLGLFQIPFYEHLGYGHTGGIDGFTSVFAFFPETKVSYVLFSNGANYDTNEISLAVLSSVYGKDFSIPVFMDFEIAEEDLKRFIGTYESEQLPLKISVFVKDSVLNAQATGQPSFPLDPKDEKTFEFAMAGVVIVFDADKETLLLKQGGGEFLFKKEK